MEQLPILEQSFLGNPIQSFFECAGILLLGLLLKRFGATFLSKQSYRLFRKFAHNKYSEELVALIRKPFEQLIALVILFLAFNRLAFPEAWDIAARNTIGLRWLLHTVWMLAMFVVGTRILLRATDFFAIVLSHREESTVSAELANFLKELIKVLLVVMVIFAGLRFIFHVNITALVASLGIGGLAVALAAQDTLANLLGSFIIYLDKPFKTGDYVEAGEIKGTIEHVGFRTTRVRTLEKSLLTVPNKKLIDAALNNITMSEARRVRFNLMLTYQSKSSQIKGIIDDIMQALTSHPLVLENPIVRFADFDSSSLNILIIYFVKGNEYETMITVKEELNIKIMEIVEKHGCEFAFPTQTIYLQK
ncbi:MAG: mechanosensitive ion channel family protein [Bacteroidia bacterium]|jgi:MscS family membrane protein|nr:mechanosensitive ion channel family protein [Bacteroidia bacterium]